MSETLEDLIAASQRGLSAHLIDLGYSYLVGRDPAGNTFSPNYVEARKWFEKVHAKGVLTATYFLATMYEEGKGAPVDLTKAVALYETAAARDDIRSCIRLARLYAQEKSAIHDIGKAAAWYRRVMEFERESGVVEEVKEARTYLKRS
jgi:TPR repeat protein